MAQITNHDVTRRNFVKGGLAASALAALAACGKKSDGGSAASGDGAQASSDGTVKYYISNPDCIDAYNLNEDQGTQVGYVLFDSLTDFDYDADKLVPKAADSWEANDEATEFTFHLHEGAKFHNGEDVDAESFVRGWSRVVNPSYGHSNAGVLDYHLALVEGYDECLADTTGKVMLSGCTAKDKYTFVVKLTKPYADFPYVAAHPALAPAPKAVDLAANDDNKAALDAFYLAPIGNGPFQMDGSWVDGQYINVKAFDDYYGDKPKVKAIQFNIQKDVETAYREFTAGNYDVSEVPPASISDALSQYGQAEDGYTATPGKQVLTGAEVSVYYLNLNCQDKVLQDVDVRRAISLAINRQAICDTLYNGIRKPADDILPPKIVGYKSGAWKYSKYDKDAAAKLLDAKYPANADGKRDLKITISYNPEGGHKEIMEMVQADLQAIGIDAQADTREWKAILADYRSGNAQAGRLGWTADYPIADNFLYSLFVSTGIGGDNCSMFSDPEIDDLLNKARNTVDDDERVKLMQEADEKIGDACPVAPIMYYAHSIVASKKFKSFKFDAARRNHMGAAELA